MPNIFKNSRLSETTLLSSLVEIQFLICHNSKKCFQHLFESLDPDIMIYSNLLY